MITMVTVTYADRLNFLGESVRRALEENGVDRVVIVSNGSTSPLEILEQQWGDRVQIIRLKENSGSAKGFAVGIQAAMDDGAAYIWLMDDDNAPQPGALQALQDVMEKLAGSRPLNDFALLSFREIHQSDLLAGLPRARLFPKPGSFIGFHLLDLPYKLVRRTRWGKTPRPEALPESISLPHAHYGGLFCHRSLYERIGLPDVNLVLYADDVELTSRLTSAGGEIFLLPASRIDDLESSWNDKVKFGSFLAGWLCGPSDLRAFYSARNQAYLAEKIPGPIIWKSVNRWAYLTIMFALAVRLGRLARFRLLADACQKGRAGTLGVEARFPLP